MLFLSNYIIGLTVLLVYRQCFSLQVQWCILTIVVWAYKEDCFQSIIYGIVNVHRLINEGMKTELNIFYIVIVYPCTSWKMKINRGHWTLNDYKTYFRPGLFNLHNILTADFVRINICLLCNLSENLCVYNEFDL